MRSPLLMLVCLAWSAIGCGGHARSNEDRQETSGSSGGSSGTNEAGVGNVSANETGCTFEGKQYQVGESFRPLDGCGWCQCSVGDTVACTAVGCIDTCEAQATHYEEAVELAKVCDPGHHDQCTFVFSEGLICGCHAFANPAKRSAIAKLENAQLAYSSQQCEPAAPCPKCGPPLIGYCSEGGRCMTGRDLGGVGCKVGGVVYPNGTTGIPDPVSCNTCRCQDGNLDCTDKVCSKPCPAGTMFGNQCAMLRPTG